MNPIARIVFRRSDKNDGLGLVCTFKDGKSIFKANEIWEIREVLGELVLVKLGKSIMRSTKPKVIGFTWGVDISGLLRTCRKYMWLTEEEYNKLK